ncbi:hypothetical protein [Halopseudomonas salegens]|nr:hypothetical protein [Halopseudomonas salegens]
MLLPPMLGLLVMLILFGLDDGSLAESLDDAVAELPFILGAAFVLTLIPSLLAFVAFELALSKVLKSRASYVLVAAAFGYLSGLAMLYAINQALWLLHPVNFIGLFVGGCSGYVLHLLYRS